MTRMRWTRDTEEEKREQAQEAIDAMSKDMARRIFMETHEIMKKQLLHDVVDTKVYLAEKEVMRAKRRGEITEIDEADFFAKTADIRDANAGLPPSSFGYGWTCGDSCHDEEDPSRSEIKCHKGHSTKGRDKNLSK